MPPCGSQRVTGIPDSDVDTVVSDLQLDNPIQIDKTKAGDGSWTVTATFPPCESSLTHAEHVAANAPATSVAGAAIQGFDLNRDCGKLIPKILAAGIKFVARYYSHSATKNIGPSEAQALSSAGVDIVSVWESGGDHPAFFSRAQGIDDATSAAKQAQSVGQPAGTPIYFAVDYDASQAELNSAIVPYFQGVADGLRIMASAGPTYGAGVYGSGLVCGTLFGQGLVTHTWLSMSTGFRDSKIYTAWNIKQHLTADPFGLGVQVDPDEAKGDYGGFRV